MERLQEKYVEFVSKTHNISLEDATKYIDKCIKETSKKIGIEYSKVYQRIFSKDFLSKCLVKENACDDLELEKCQKECSCFYLEPYGCMSRKIPDVGEINRDPNKYIEKYLGKTGNLEKLVKIASYLYYNYDGGGLTDNSFDALEHNLRKRLKYKGRRYEKIGAPPVEKIRAELPYNLPSLDKIKPGMKATFDFLKQFVERPKFECIWSDKLDGVSGMIIYRKGKIHKIYTRGDGVIGGDVTYLKKYLKSIPKTIGISNEFVVRGEFVILKNKWEKKYKDTYSNPRTFVSAKINAGYISPGIQDMDFVAYQIMKYDSYEFKLVPKPSKAYGILRKRGFLVVDNGKFIEPTVFNVISKYIFRRKSSPYAIDGLVLTPNEETNAAKPASEKVINPSNAKAFKMMLESQMRDTKVINIEWNITRHGRLFPKVIYEGVYIDGTRQTKATGHSANWIISRHIGKNTKIRIVRSGDVIPQIKYVDIDPKTKPILPDTYGKYKYPYHRQGANFVLNDIKNNEEVHIKRMTYFFEIMNIPGIRGGTLKNFYAEGLSNVQSIFNATVSEMTKVKRVGRPTAVKLKKNLEASLQYVPPDRILVASTTFKAGIGREVLKKVFRKIPNLLSLNEDDIKEKFKRIKISGIAGKTIPKIISGIPKFKEYIKTFGKENVKRIISYYPNQAKLPKNPKIEGKKFILTGFKFQKNYNLEDYIYNNMGDMVLTFKEHDIDAVISNNLMSITEKMKTALDLEIPVFSVDEFIERYDVSI